MKVLALLVSCVLVLAAACSDDEPVEQEGIDIYVESNDEDSGVDSGDSPDTGDTGDADLSGCPENQIFIDAINGEPYRRCMPDCSGPCEQCLGGQVCIDGECPVGQVYIAEINGEPVNDCYHQCDDGECPSGFYCTSSVCLPE